MDKDFISDIIKKYGNTVFNIAYRFTGNYTDANDLSQEAFIKMLNHFNPQKVISENSIKSWLYRVIKNLYLNMVERDKSRQCTISMDNDCEDEKSKELPDCQSGLYGNPEKIAEEKEYSYIIQNALEKLPQEFRITVILRDLQDFSYEEIAKITGTSTGTVKSRLFRGRKMMSEFLKNNISFTEE